MSILHLVECQVFLNFVTVGSHAIALRDFELQPHIKLKTAEPRERRHPAGIGTNIGKLASNAAAAQFLLAQLRVNRPISMRTN